MQRRNFTRPIYKTAWLLLLNFCAVAAGAQADFSSTLPARYAAYQKQAVTEKVYAHTDKALYLTGEILWFKLYVVDGATHRFSPLSKVAYVELLDAGGKAVLQAKIGLKEGTGDGSLLVPASVNSGVYALRVYTAWMKNFGTAVFFQKPITIVNTLKRPDWKKLLAAAPNDVQFFPEGGHLVAGLQSNVAFKAIDPHGKGLACSGTVVRDNGDTAVRFQTLQFGMGHFLFTPVSGAKYKALIRFEDGQTLQRELPAIAAEGYVMTTTAPDSNHLTVTVAAANVPDATVYLFLHNGRNEHGVLKKFASNGKALFDVDTRQFDAGLAYLTLFSESGQPLCERLYFKRPPAPLRLQAATDSARYALRKKVTLAIQTAKDSLTADATELSVSVFRLDSLQQPDAENLYTYLWLTSELRGTVENPAYYFNTHTPERDAALENLLLTQGWRRFSWEQIQSGNTPAFSFLPEYEGHLVSGKITRAGSGAAVMRAGAFLSVPGQPFRFTYAVSDGQGVVHFMVPNYYGGDVMIVQPADSANRIELQEPFAAVEGKMSLPPFAITSQAAAWLQEQHLSAQAQQAFYSTQQQHFYLTDKRDSARFFSPPDRSYNLDDYTRFTTMEEVLQEYVTEVRVRRSADQFHYQMRNIPYKTFFDKDALVLLDGVPVLNTTNLMAFDPLKIQKLDVVARKYFFNDLVADGIASFSTYSHDLAGFTLPSSALVMDYTGLQLKREFYTPVYETTEAAASRLPDFRNVLTWMPDLRTDENGKAQLSFYTSDLPGTYVVRVQGLTTAGTAGEAMATFTVQQ